MKYLVIILIAFQLSIFQVHCRTLIPLEAKGNRTEVGQQRSARVHRISIDELHEKEASPTQTILDKKMSKIKPLLGSQKIDNILPDLPGEQADTNNTDQRKAQLTKRLKPIFKDGTNTFQDVDLSITERIDTATRNLLNSPEELDIYYQDRQDGDKILKSKIEMLEKTSQIESTNNSELKIVENIAQYLDTVLLDVQNHVNHIRSIFEKLCRKHHSTPSVHLETNGIGKFAKTNQPKKVSIL